MVTYYDLDDTFLGIQIIHSGEASFTLQGAHKYEILTDNTKFYEFKTGPYLGQLSDKVFID